MILDTTYLPLARTEIDKDLLRAIVEGKVKLRFNKVTVSSISIFELQAKAAELEVPAKFVIEAVEAIHGAFKVEPLNKPEVVEVSFKPRRSISDYIGCVIIGTAIALREDPVTEDSRILANRSLIKESME